MTGTVTRHALRAEGVALGYDGRVVVPELHLTVPDGQVSVIVGANGSGKSTVLRGFARLLRPVRGVITLDGENLHRMPHRRVARIVGLLPQQPVAPESMTVADLVGRGRYPHRGWLSQRSSTDDAAVGAALAATGTLELASRRVDELSGGQRQRVWIAMLLAQEPDVMLLDEPTTFLDVAHQIEVLDLLTQLNRERGATVVMVLHDLNLAARYADHLIVMAGGRITGAGAPAEVLTAQRLWEAFGVRAEIVPDPVCGAPMVVPMGRFHGTAQARPTPDAS